jgi:hypothetical protein
MRPPIFAYNKGDLLVFDSVKAAELYIEPIDIANREYVFYDARGCVLEARIGKTGSFGRKRVELLTKEEIPSAASSWKRELRRF